MAAALSLVVQRDIQRAFAPEIKKDSGASLRAQVLDLELLVDTVYALDPEGLEAELRAELEQDLAASIAGTKAKIDNTAAALGVFEAAAAAAAKEAARLNERVAYFERQQNRLEAYVIAVIEASKIKKLDGFTSTLSIRMNPPSVRIADGTVLAPEFLRTPAPPPPPAPQPDKNVIKEALKGGAMIPGCSLVQGVKLVRS